MGFAGSAHSLGVDVHPSSLCEEIAVERRGAGIRKAWVLESLDRPRGELGLRDSPPATVEQTIDWGIPGSLRGERAQTPAGSASTIELFERRPAALFKRDGELRVR